MISLNSFKNKFGSKINNDKELKQKNSFEKDSQLSEFFFPIIEDGFDHELNRDDYGKTINEVTEKTKVKATSPKKSSSSLTKSGFDRTPESNWAKFKNKESIIKPHATVELKSWHTFQNKLTKDKPAKKDIHSSKLGAENEKRSFLPLEVPPPMHLINNPTTQPIEFELGTPDSKIITRMSKLSKKIASNENSIFSDQTLVEKILMEEIEEDSFQIDPVQVEEVSFQTNSIQVEGYGQSSQTSVFEQRVSAAIAQKTQSTEQMSNQVHNTNNQSYSDFIVETSGYIHPPFEFLQPRAVKKDDNDWMESQADILDETFFHFNVNARVVNCTQGPSVTRFEIQPEPGVKVNKISNLSDDLKLALAARDIRIEAPIPGKSQVGIEIPNRQSRPVFIREIIETEAFVKHPSPLNVAVGLDISGEPVTTDLVRMPHGLVAGSTGSGKSVFINSILISLLYKSSPEDVKLLLIDPKMVELSNYNGIPHLVAPVITDPKAATASLKWAVEEMDRRYELFAAAGVRDIVRYNEKVKEYVGSAVKLPYIVIIIDELADLMMTASQDVEAAICRIAQKARACGMHLIVATQRPSVDVITGLIKSNIATRVAFAVASNIDSRTILDQSGAEKLLGRGDMLFLENGSSKSVRLQGTFVSDDEIERVVSHVKMQAEPSYLFVTEDLLKSQQSQSQSQGGDADYDELFFEACEFAVSSKYISTSSLQRRYRIGYNRAARIVDLMEQNGIISEANGTKPRDVLIREDDLETLKELLDMGNF
ncbi:MAG: ftsK [Bacillales bacterium]|nr:ftsK [Bacillales bacterium]